MLSLLDNIKQDGCISFQVRKWKIHGGGRGVDVWWHGSLLVMLSLCGSIFSSLLFSFKTNMWACLVLSVLPMQYMSLKSGLSRIHDARFVAYKLDIFESLEYLHILGIHDWANGLMKDDGVISSFNFNLIFNFNANVVLFGHYAAIIKSSRRRAHPLPSCHRQSTCR